jgi:hypothetical protein
MYGILYWGIAVVLAIFEENLPPSVRQKMVHNLSFTYPKIDQFCS